MTSTDLARPIATGHDIAEPEQTASALSHYLATGDLSKLSGEERAALYVDTCRSLGINARTRPFDWIEFYDPETKGKKLTLYPNRSCAEQLRRQHQISVRIVSEEIVGKLFKVVVEGRRPNGVTDTATSYVPLTDRDDRPLVGQRLANAFMKGQTTAKRRLTFSMVGMYSPPEIEDLQRARVVTVDGRGNILDHPTDEQRYLAENPGAAKALGEPIFEDLEIGESDLPSQEVRPDELERPKREGLRPTFRSSDETVKRWLGAWFATVKGLSLDSDEARARYVSDWTNEWPENKRTDSLRSFFARCTDAEASDFLAHVRALCDDEKEELLRQSHENMPDPEPPKRGRSKVADSVALTGGPVTETDDGEPEAF